MPLSDCYGAGGSVVTIPTTPETRGRYLTSPLTNFAQAGCEYCPITAHPCMDLRTDHRKMPSAFAFCSSPTWIGVSESLYGAVSRIPLVSSIANTFIMQTFFRQFLGGQTINDCVPKIETLREKHIGTLLGYNIEAELDGSSKDPQLISMQTQHVLSSIEAQGMMVKKSCPDMKGTGASKGDHRAWVRIKMTGM